MDKVATERCEYDDIEIDFDYDKTWDWYIAKFILDFKQNYPNLEGNIHTLGDDVLYSGILETGCEIELYSKGQDGIVVSNIRVKTTDDNGYTSTTDFGTVFGGNLSPIELGDETKKLKIVDGRYVEGAIQNGMVVQQVGSSTAILYKTIDGPKNYLNAIWLPVREWKSNIIYEGGVGSVDPGDFDTT